MTTTTVEGTTAVSMTTEKPTTSSATRTTEHSVSLMSKRQLIPQAGLWTTKSTIRNTVNVSVLQPGSLRSLSDVKFESVGAISLINDNGRLLLVDTGAASDMERLLQTITVDLVDMFVFTLLLVKGVHIYVYVRSNPVVNAWLVTSVLLFVLHVICIFADWYGILRERPLWMIPKIVLKTVTVFVFMCATPLIAYLLWDDSNVVQFLVTQNTNLEYHASRSTIVIGGSVLIILFTLFTALQVWLLLVLLDCFNLIQARHEQRLIDKCCNLAKESVTLDEIDTVVITHGHPGHMGNMNFFGRKPILFHTMEYVGRQVTPTELKDRPYRKLSTNVEVWRTPGHTQHDLSVLVHNVPGYGSMVIVGDLIPSEEFLAEKTDVMTDEGVWDSAIKRQNANLVICMADWVIPGHGQPFRVLPHYRQKAGCTRLAQQRLLSIH
ncbi:Uncharacterized protein C03F11.2 [Toxocara canis]|uniref:Uncharacterized protein C03F11.2 n=1 Tax=Toxocara canis TaxID=6265 RepID=A0A0B2VLA8_TOXCA|nr:Uncharacterized protein C03F11.2 [Toxocara canis]